MAVWEGHYPFGGSLAWFSLGLGGGGDSQLELAGSVVGARSEVDEVFESASHSLGELDCTVDGLKSRRGALLQVVQSAVLNAKPC